jgi:hypothetical protein
MTPESGTEPSDGSGVKLSDGSGVKGKVAESPEGWTSYVVEWEELRRELAEGRRNKDEVFQSIEEFHTRLDETPFADLDEVHEALRKISKKYPLAVYY